MPFNFESVNALDYDELRPSYAADAVAWVYERARLGANAVVVDLAAGTGQLAKGFVALGVRVIAVEPATNMRSVLESNLPSVRVVDGTAERIPLGDATADAVVVGNAFHHFDVEAAFAELRRVIRPGGALALFWADADADGVLGPIARAVDRVVERARVSASIIRAYRKWTEPPERIEGFTPFERRSFGTTQAIDPSRLADLFATSSDVASLPPPNRDALLERIRTLASDYPSRLTLIGRSDVLLCFRA